MANYRDNITVAKYFRGEMDRFRQSHRTVGRMEITEKLREVTKEEVRISSTIGGDAMDRAFLEQGLRAFPQIKDTTTGDKVRLIRTGTPANDILDMYLNPDPETDMELGKVINKIKGRIVN